jgi:hypothetical protein
MLLISYRFCAWKPSTSSNLLPGQPGPAGLLRFSCLPACSAFLDAYAVDSFLSLSCRSYRFLDFFSIFGFPPSVTSPALPALPILSGPSLPSGPTLPSVTSRPSGSSWPSWIHRPTLLTCPWGTYPPSWPPLFCMFPVFHASSSDLALEVWTASFSFPSPGHGSGLRFAGVGIATLGLLPSVVR